MTDTIEWLEAIGKNAKLRRAPVEELAQLLVSEDAPATLRDALIKGSRLPLVAELGDLLMQTANVPNGPGHEEDPDDDEDDEQGEADESRSRSSGTPSSATH